MKHIEIIGIVVGLILCLCVGWLYTIIIGVVLYVVSL
jgi:hypothetical protein